MSRPNHNRRGLPLLLPLRLSLSVSMTRPLTSTRFLLQEDAPPLGQLLTGVDQEPGFQG